MRPLKIALCGGPCGGKTTALPFVKQQLEARGFTVYVVPEVATMFGEAGFKLGEVYSKSGKQLQTTILKTMMQLEDSVEHLAKLLDKPSVIVCDRGVMDCQAFTFPPVWEAILKENNWSNLELQSRYDAIFYMITAADGAREFYGNSSNKVRGEDARHAQEVCEKNRLAWLSHPHLRIFDNSTNLATKISRLCNSVNKFVDSVETERRFLVNKATIDIPVETVFIEQTYLKADDRKTERIRRRGYRNSWIYTHTIKHKKVNGSGIELEEQISELEYETLKLQADPDRRPIFKKRNYFIWDNQQFELDEFVDPLSGTLILEVELDDINQDIELPPFIHVEKEITNDSSYSNRAIAKLAAAI